LYIPGGKFKDSGFELVEGFGDVELWDGFP
jgi:hypothetical protein